MQFTLVTCEVKSSKIKRPLSRPPEAGGGTAAEENVFAVCNLTMSERTLNEVDHLFKIRDELDEAKAKWRIFGLALGISPSDLEAIHQETDDTCTKFQKVILKWLRGENDHTWNTLCEALATNSVGLKALATRIRKKWITGSIAEEPLPFSQEQSPPCSEVTKRSAVSTTSQTQIRRSASSPTTSIQPPPVADSVENVGSESATVENEEDSLSQGSIRPASQLSMTSLSSQENLGSSSCTAMDTSSAQPTASSQEMLEASSSTTSMEISSVIPTPVKVMALAASNQNVTTTEDGDTPETTHRQLTLREGIKLRDYQKELAYPGLQGDNYILVAPTGTGKTLIAGYVIMQHLNKRLEEGGKVKVAFVTPTRHLTSQQKKKLEKYISEIRAETITGASGKPMHPLVQSSGVDVVVCTAGKLRQELKTESIKITDFSLIVFDECHHAGRPSNYSDIMEFLIRLKLTDGSAHLPQMLGMTASPGAGKSKTSTEEAVLDHQISLCATLNATAGIIAVRQNTKELESVCNEPRTSLEVRDERFPDDSFVRHVNTTMEKLECSISCTPCLERGSLKYNSWLKREKEAAEKREEDERERISILDQLEVYSRCLLTYRDFRYEDAMSVLEEIQEFPDQSNFECSLYEVHKKLIDRVYPLPKTSNQLLDRMKTLLVQQFDRCPESKVICFVETIKYTRYITNWIQSSPVLSPLIRASSITGQQRKGGMVRSEQLKVLERFHSGHYNFLASTSVLEEGLDVPECNFVIRYQIVSSEIAQVQAKGRARAKDSQMHTILSANSNKQYRYLVLEEKQRMVETAISALQSKDITPFLAKKQKAFIEARDRKAELRRSRRSHWPNTDEVEIRCKKCNILACKGSEVFSYNTSDTDPQYVVPKREFCDLYDKVKHDKPVVSDNFVKPHKMKCHSPSCRSQWGVIGHWNDTGFEFPVLKCASFLFKYGNSTERFKKWSDIYFDIQDIQDWAGFEDDEVQERQQE